MTQQTSLDALFARPAETSEGIAPAPPERPQLALRDYQQECLDVLRDRVAAGERQLLVALPTGTGKTVVFSRVPEALGFERRVLVLAHREELLDQAARKFRASSPGVYVGIEQAQRKAPHAARIVVASVQTLRGKRLEVFNPSDFDAVIVDEAHHAVARTYRAIFEYFGCIGDDAERPLIGFTATPRRGDNVGLGAVFKSIAFKRTLQEMIDAGWLCPIAGYRIETGLDLSGVKVRAGEFVQGQLAEAIDTDARNQLIVDSWMQLARDRKALAFTASVEHAHRLADAFNAAGVSAAPIDGGTEKELRRDRIARFATGELTVLTNCNVLTEGFDEPSVAAVLMARPTKSQLLYTQMVGRGTRLHESKSDTLVLDFADNSERHSLVSTASLFGLPPRLDLQGKPAREVQKRFEHERAKLPWLDVGDLRRADEIGKLAARVDLFHSRIPEEIEKATRYAWQKIADGFELSLPAGEKLVVDGSLVDVWTLRLFKKGEPAQAREFPSAVDAVRAADDWLSKARSEQRVLVDTKAPWRRRQASEKQKAYLRRRGVAFPDDISRGQASAIIGMLPRKAG